MVMSMITNADRELLNETYRNANMAVKSIYSVISKVEDEDLALDLNRQVGKYQSIQDRAEDALLSAGHCPEPSKMEKWMLQASIFGKTLRDRTTEHIADMMIQGNAKSITETRKILNDNPTAKGSYCEMAGELIAFEQGNIERLKQYL